MLPDSPVEFEYYDGQEAEDVDPDLGLQDWEDLNESEQCQHVQSLNETKPTSRNRLRFTRRWEVVGEEMAAITAGQVLLGTEIEGLIEQRWDLSLDQFLPKALKPLKLKPEKNNNEFWDPPVVAAIAVLASLTPGQSRLAAGFLEEAVQMRIGDGDDVSTVVQLGDAVNAVTIIYERAGVVKEKLTKAKSGKAREREKKKAVRERRKKGKGGVGGDE